MARYSEYILTEASSSLALSSFTVPPLLHNRLSLPHNNALHQIVFVALENAPVLARQQQVPPDALNRPLGRLDLGPVLQHVQKRRLDTPFVNAPHRVGDCRHLLALFGELPNVRPEINLAVDRGTVAAQKAKFVRPRARQVSLVHPLPVPRRVDGRKIFRRRRLLHHRRVALPRHPRARPWLCKLTRQFWVIYIHKRKSGRQRSRNGGGLVGRGCRVHSGNATASPRDVDHVSTVGTTHGNSAVGHVPDFYHRLRRAGVHQPAGVQRLVVDAARRAHSRNRARFSRPWRLMDRP